MRIDQTQDTEVIRTLGEHWGLASQGEIFGLIVNVDDTIDCLQRQLDYATGSLLVAYEGDPVGFVSVFSSQSVTSKDQKVAVVTMCFGEHPFAAKAMYEAARKWAKEKECTHIIVNPSRLATDKYERVCHLWERLGMIPFENNYISKLE